MLVSNLLKRQPQVPSKSTVRSFTECNDVVPFQNLASNEQRLGAHGTSEVWIWYTWTTWNRDYMSNCCYSHANTTIWKCPSKLQSLQNNRFQKQMANQWHPTLTSRFCTTLHQMKVKWNTLISHRLRGHAMSDLFLLKSQTAARVV